MEGKQKSEKATFLRRPIVFFSSARNRRRSLCRYFFLRFRFFFRFSNPLPALISFLLQSPVNPPRVRSIAVFSSSLSLFLGFITKSPILQVLFLHFCCILFISFVLFWVRDKFDVVHGNVWTLQ